MFDPTKPYAYIRGDAGDARFEQAGKLYDAKHREVELVETHERNELTGLMELRVSTRRVPTAPQAKPVKATKQVADPVKDAEPADTGEDF